VRETFFVSMIKELYYANIVDFKVNDFIIEIGGKYKTFRQIKDIQNSFLIEIGSNKIIPLWIFGFLY